MSKNNSCVKNCENEKLSTKVSSWSARNIVC